MNKTLLLVVLVLLVTFISYTQAAIFPRGQTLQDIPKGYRPFGAPHVPEFAQNVLITMSVGPAGVNLSSIYIPKMQIASSFLLPIKEAQPPVVDDIPFLKAVIVSGLSPTIYSFAVDSNTGVLSKKGQYGFTATPISLGVDRTDANGNGNLITYYMNSSVWYVNLANSGAIEVNQGFVFAKQLVEEDYVVTGYSGLSKQWIILQIVTESTSFVIYNITNGLVTKQTSTVESPDFELFVPTDSANATSFTGYLFKTIPTSFDTGRYDIIPYDIIQDMPVGPRRVVPGLLFGSNIIAYARNAVMFLTAFNGTSNYLNQIFVGDNQIQGISFLRDPLVEASSIGASDSYVFAHTEARIGPGPTIYTLNRYDYNGAH